MERAAVAWGGRREEELKLAAGRRM